MLDAHSYYGSKQISDNIVRGAMGRADGLKFCLPETLAGKRILDVGCGPGVQVRYLAEKNLACGLDVGLPVLAKARESGLSPCLANCEGGHLPFADEAFDIVICTDVLEHLFAPQNLLAEICRVLKDDGCAILGVPNHFDITGRLQILLGGNLLRFWDVEDFKAWDYFHLHFFTLKDFHDFLDDGGFRVLQAHHTRQPSNFVHVVALLNDSAYRKDWHRRHGEETIKRVLVFLLSVFLRVTCLGRIVPRWLPKRFPTLFSGGFLVTAGKKAAPEQRLTEQGNGSSAVYESGA